MATDGASAEAPRARARGAARGGEVSASRGVSRAGAGQGLVAPRGGRARPGGLLGEAGRGASRLVREAAADPERVGGPLLQVVRGRQAERLVQLPRSPRGGRQGRQGGVPLAGRGGRGARDHLRRPAPRRAAVRERAARPRHRQGGRGRHLPADGSRGGCRDARLRANRRPSQRRLRRLLPGRRQGADGVLGREGAGDDRRRAAQGQDGADQAAGGREDRRRRVDRDDLRRQAHRRGLRDGRGPRRLVPRRARGRRRPLRARAARRRASAVRALHVWIDGEAEGRPPHDRRLPGRRQLHAPLRVRPEARLGRLLVRRRRRLGHRAQLHRLRAALQRRHQRHVRGSARLPGQGHLVVARRALRGDDPVHGADRDSSLHEVGRGASGQARSVVAAPAGQRRRADQPEGVAVVPQGDRRRALPDRRHLVADGDRPHPDQPAARGHRDEARLGDQAAAGHRRRGGRRERATRSPTAARGSW